MTISLCSQALSSTLAPLLEPTLVILDDLTTLPEPGPLLTLLRSNHTHIITLCHALTPPDNFRKEIDQQLIRGLNVVPLKPLSRLHSTQRMVHSVVCEYEFVPHTEEQKMLLKIADNVGGSPNVVDVSSALLIRCVQECEVEGKEDKFLREFNNRVFENGTNTTSDDSEKSITQFTSNLIAGFNLTQTERVLLNSLAMFGPVPVPKSVVEKAQSYVMMASSETPGSLMPVSNLISAKMLLVYPSPVIAPPTTSLMRATAPHSSNRRGSTHSAQLEEEADYFYVPQLIKDSLWESMTSLDQEIAIATAYKCIEQSNFDRNSNYDDNFNAHLAGGLIRMLIELVESKSRTIQSRTVFDTGRYQELIRLYVNLRIGKYGS